jgi:hypothetical protein
MQDDRAQVGNVRKGEARREAGASRNYLAGVFAMRHGNAA